MKNRIEMMQIEKPQLLARALIEEGRLTGDNAKAHPRNTASSWSPRGSEQQRSMEVK